LGASSSCGSRPDRGRSQPLRAAARYYRFGCGPGRPLTAIDHPSTRRGSRGDCRNLGHHNSSRPLRNRQTASHCNCSKFCGWVSWIAVIATINVSAQMALPAWAGAWAFVVCHGNVRLSDRRSTRRVAAAEAGLFLRENCAPGSSPSESASNGSSSAFRQARTGLCRHSNRSLCTGENSARKKLGEARDLAGISGDKSRFGAAETALSRVSGGKASESQSLFRTRQETGIAQDCVVGPAVLIGRSSVAICLLTGNFLHFYVKNRPRRGAWRPTLQDLFVVPLG
jgi:hypothetical protein